MWPVSGAISQFFHRLLPDVEVELYNTVYLCCSQSQTLQVLRYQNTQVSCILQLIYIKFCKPA